MDNELEDLRGREERRWLTRDQASAYAEYARALYEPLRQSMPRLRSIGCCEDFGSGKGLSALNRLLEAEDADPDAGGAVWLDMSSLSISSDE